MGTDVVICGPVHIKGTLNLICIKLFEITSCGIKYLMAIIYHSTKSLVGLLVQN